ncbi:unnamed protein product [Cunninghamella blakesleeana]
MSDLPYEIIKTIVSPFPIRSLLQYTFINKHWNVVCHDILYHTVKLYTGKQLKKFLYTAKTFIIRNKPIGYYVQILNLEHFINCNIGRVNKNDMIELRHTCPNAFIIGSHTFASIPLLHYLQPKENNYHRHHHNNDSNSNSNYTQFNINNICDKFNFLQLDVLSELQSGIGILKYQTDDEKMERHRTINDYYLESYWDSDDNDNEDDNNDAYSIKKGLPYLIAYTHLKEKFKEYHPFYYGKTLSFTLKSSSTKFHHLKELHLQFSCYFQQVIPEMAEFDERSIDSILTSCPNLKVLKLYRFFMNHHQQFNNNYYSKRIPYTSLETLILDKCIFIEPQCCEYFSSTFPSITALDVYLKLDTECFSDRDEFYEHVLQMITSFSNLYHLKYHSAWDETAEEVIIGRSLLTWLISNYRIKSFHMEDYSGLYYYNTESVIDSIYNDNNENNNSNENNGNNNNPPLSANSMEIERTIVVDSEIMVYSYILKNKNNQIIPHSTSALKVVALTLVTFLPDQWLVILKNLSKLSLQKMHIRFSENYFKYYGQFTQLKHLILNDCHFYSLHTLTTIFEMCLLLKSLELNDITIEHDDAVPIIQKRIIMASDIEFEKVIIRNITFGISSSMRKRSYYSLSSVDSSYKATALILNELKYENIVTIGLDIKKNNTFLEFVCQSTDTIVFDNENSWESFRENNYARFCM